MLRNEIKVQLEKNMIKKINMKFDIKVKWNQIMRDELKEKESIRKD